MKVQVHYKRFKQIHQLVQRRQAQSPPQLLRIVDVLGRESKPKPNTPLFYIYENGTVEKKIHLKTHR